MELYPGSKVQEFPTSFAGYLDRSDGSQIDFAVKIDSPEDRVQTRYLRCNLKN